MKSTLVVGLVVVLGTLTGCESPSVEGGLFGRLGATDDGDEAESADAPTAKDAPASGTTTTPPTEPATTEAPAPAGQAPTVACDRTKPFGAAVPVAGLSSTDHNATPRLSADERTIFYTGHVGDQARLRFATRASIDAPFGAPQPLDALSSKAKDNDPSVSADGKVIFFSSERNGSTDLFTATRASIDLPFASPTAVSVANTSGDEGHPYFRQSGNELWLSSSRSGAWEIYVARGGQGTFGTPVLVPELSGGKTQQPMITEDGLTIIFSSDRAGGKGGRDLWQATRGNAIANFGKPTPIQELNSSATESAGWLSADGCRIYFSSNRDHDDHHTIFRATRPR